MGSLKKQLPITINFLASIGTLKSIDIFDKNYNILLFKIVRTIVGIQEHF